MTLDQIMKLRVAKRFRAPAVTFWLDGEYLPLPNKPEIALKPTDNVNTIDLRAVTGLIVHIHTNRLTDQSEALFQRLKEYAALVIVAVIDNFEESHKWYKSTNSLMPL